MRSTFLLPALLATALAVQAQVAVSPGYTPYTATFLLSTNAEAARSILGVSTNGGSSGTATNLAPGATGADLTLWGVLTANGAGLTNLNGLVNVCDFGATASDASDDTLAFEAALATGKGIFIPHGYYYLSNTLVPPGSFVHIVGAGYGKTFLYLNTAGMDGLHIGKTNNIAGGLLADFALYGLNKAANGIILGGTTTYRNATITCRNLDIRSCTNAALQVYAAMWTRLEDCQFHSSYYGLEIKTNTSGSTQSTTLAAERCHFASCTNAGAFFNWAQGFTFSDCVFEGNKGAGTWFYTAETGGSQSRFWNSRFLNCWWEGNNASATYSNLAQLVFQTTTNIPVRGAALDGCTFASPVAPDVNIYFGPGFYTVRGCTFNTPMTDTLRCADSPYVVIRGDSWLTENTSDAASPYPTGPDSYWGANLPANANVCWTSFGSTNYAGRGATLKPFITWINGGDGTLVPAQVTKGSTSGSIPTTTFRGLLSVGGTNGVSATKDVLVAGGTTNRLVFVGGILVSNLTSW